jgi:hypothetical protein
MVSRGKWISICIGILYSAMIWINPFLRFKIFVPRYSHIEIWRSCAFERLSSKTVLFIQIVFERKMISELSWLGLNVFLAFQGFSVA